MKTVGLFDNKYLRSSDCSRDFCKKFCYKFSYSM